MNTIKIIYVLLLGGVILLISKITFADTIYFKNKQFTMEYADNEIDTVKTEFKTLYTDKLMPTGKAVPMFTLNKTKLDQLNLQQWEST